MTILVICAPISLSSAESQSNDLVVDKTVKESKQSLTIFLFGGCDEIQRYIPSLYTILWDYCLLYDRTSLECIIIPQYGELVDNQLLCTSGEEIFVPSTISNSILTRIDDCRRNKGISPLSYFRVCCDVWSESVISLDWESSKNIHLTTVCVGGTFDCLHPGHKILLTLASLVCDSLTIGLTTDLMLQKKSKHEFIKSYEEREHILKSFLKTIAPRLHVDIYPLVDIYGPSVLKEEMEGIVVSLETLEGAKMINKVRSEKNMKPLTILTVNRASKYNLSSTFIRNNFHEYSSLNRNTNKHNLQF